MAADHLGWLLTYLLGGWGFTLGQVSIIRPERLGPWRRAGVIGFFVVVWLPLLLWGTAKAVTERRWSRG